jgi:hypothetical protein
MAQAQFDIVAATKKYKAELYEFYLNMGAWRTFRPGRPALTWQRVKFEVSNKPSVPNVPGLYVFTLELEYPSFPEHGYILYVGQTGANSQSGSTSSRTLRERFGEYFHEKRSASGRAAIKYMLNEWDGDLSFYYAPIPNQARISKLEGKLIDATRPPVNRRFVGLEVALPRRAKF